MDFAAKLADMNKNVYRAKDTDIQTEFLEDSCSDLTETMELSDDSFSVDDIRFDNTQNQNAQTSYLAHYKFYSSQPNLMLTLDFVQPFSRVQSDPVLSTRVQDTPAVNYNDFDMNYTSLTSSTRSTLSSSSSLFSSWTRRFMLRRMLLARCIGRYVRIKQVESCPYSFLEIYRNTCIFIFPDSYHRLS